MCLILACFSVDYKVDRTSPCTKMFDTNAPGEVCIKYCITYCKGLQLIPASICSPPCNIAADDGLSCFIAIAIRSVAAF